MKLQRYSDAFQQQSLLAAYCRTGEEQPLAGITDGRIPYYRELVFNVVQDTLDTAFPLTKDWMEAAHWNELVHLFFSRHACQSAQVWKMPFEFYTFVSEEDLPYKEMYSGLEELLLLEWMEIEVFMMEDLPLPAHQPMVHLNTSPLVIHPEFRILSIHYPFHQKKTQEIHPEDHSDYYVLLYRLPRSGEVIFLDVSPNLVWMLLQLNEAPLTLSQLTGLAMHENAGLEKEILSQQFASFASHLHEQGLILGTI